MLEEKFRLPGSSYDELTKIIKAYGHHDAPASPSDVGTIAGIHQTIVSRNNAFLVVIGLLEGGKKKVMTPRGRALAAALEHDLSEEISKSWREVVQNTDFLQKILSAVKVRKGMEESTLQAHVAYSAGQAKNPMVMAGAGAIVQILRVASLLKDDDGKLVTATTEPPSHGEPSGPQVASSLVRPPIPEESAQIPVLSATQTKEGLPALTIQLQIQCSAEEIDDLGPKLRKLLEEIRRSAPAETASDE